MAVDKSMLKRFVKDNIAELTSTAENANERVKKLKVAFFIELNKKKYGIPKEKEIAEETIILLVRGKRISIDNYKEFIEKCPFLIGNLIMTDIEQLIKNICQPESILSVEDIKQLERKDFLQQKESELFQKAKEEIERERQLALAKVTEDARTQLEKEYGALDEDRMKMEAERAQIDELKSEIEDYNLDEIVKQYPEQGIPQKNIIMMDAKWWDNIGLIQNPFPSTDGFSLIDEKYFDSIILLTPIFNKYKNLIQINIDEVMNKTHIILGEYGSGKTTLFDYLSKPLLNQGIFPINIMLDAEPDENKIRRQFFKSIIMEISDKYIQSYQTDPRTLYQEFTRIETYEVLNNILSAQHYKGFVLFIDGLHKDGFYFAQVKAFIQNLQNTKDFFTRKKLPICIFIAGSKRWERDLLYSPSVGGSVHVLEKIDEIQPDEAYKMVQNRLITFSIDQEKPTKVNRSSIEKIYINLKHRLTRDVTFRDIIEDILPHLYVSDSGVISVALKFDKELLEKIKVELYSNSEFHARMQIIKDIIGTREDILMKTIETLAKAYDFRGVTEDDDYFVARKNDFALLLKAGLIKKTRIDHNKVRWIPDKIFMDVAYNLKTKFKVDLAELITEAYIDKLPQMEPIESDRYNDIERGNKIASAFEEAIPLFSLRLREAIELHSSILEHLESVTDIIPPDQIINRTNESIFKIVDALFFVGEQKGIGTYDYKLIRNKLSSTWIEVPDLIEHWDHIDYIVNRGVVIDKKVSAEITVNYKRAFSSILNSIEQYAACNSIVELSSLLLTKKDKKILHQIRVYFNQVDYARSARCLTDYMEERLRQMIYTIFVVKFGEKWRRRLGATINGYIHDQKERSKSKINPEIDNANELYYCTRSHYEHIIAVENGNWDLIFEKCFSPENIAWINESLSLISAIGDKDKHNFHESFFRKNSEKLLRCIHHSKKLLELINQSYIRVVLPENIYLINDEIYFSFKNGIDKTNLQAMRIEKEIGNALGSKIEQMIKEKDGLVINLADIQAIEYEFSTDFRTIFGVFSFALKNHRIVMTPQNGSIVKFNLP